MPIFNDETTEQKQNIANFEEYCEDEFCMYTEDGDFDRESNGQYSDVNTARLWKVWNYKQSLNNE